MQFIVAGDVSYLNFGVILICGFSCCYVDPQRSELWTTDSIIECRKKRFSVCFKRFKLLNFHFMWNVDHSVLVFYLQHVVAVCTKLSTCSTFIIIRLYCHCSFYFAPPFAKFNLLFACAFCLIFQWRRHLVHAFDFSRILQYICITCGEQYQ